ncbi:MAG: branched-chain amino acid ABC transporter permease [Deltaproteobacteria bacterium]|nr:branched-chain amino acid ABC transporter permease [Deltaproteobacteria bacterium]MBT4527652.1 branched-chain amino acid ABC transporter permease [Deltaproteobacteria bacterium]
MDSVFYQIAGIVTYGLLASGSYILMAMGLSLIYGVSGVFNYAHGSLLTIGAYIAWLLFALFSQYINYMMVFILVIPVMFYIGVGIETIIIRPLRRRPNWGFSAIIATLGLALIIDALIFIFFGPLLKTLPRPITGSIIVFGFPLNNYKMVILLVTLILSISLGLFFRRTLIGLSMRAVAQDGTGARIVGIPLNKIFGYTFGVSSVLAGISGIFLGSSYNLSPEGGWLFFIKAFIIVAVGGIGSLKGAFYAAVMLAVLESIVSFQFGNKWVMPCWFLSLMIILIFKPKGLCGER